MPSVDIITYRIFDVTSGDREKKNHIHCCSSVYYAYPYWKLGSSPLSELDSCPTSPVGVPMPSPSPLVTPPYPIPMQSFRMDQHHQAYIPLQPEQEFGAAMLATQPPPPYSIMPATPLDDMPGIFSEPLLKSGTDAHQALLMASVKSEENVSAISIEEIVKMVVSAMKNSGLTEIEKESPEEILRRKRQQNNQAAARYRKRQREARNLAEDELEQLLRRNDDLRQTSAISIEEIVKMVVSAMKNSGLTEVEKESPEEILRRKRQQNNQAAARYRKRQREARNLAEDELEQLLRRNDDLRQTVERMRLEIDELKRAVLGNPLR
ncbi:unnamed protein product [Nippostrongylus brasiliensis]|uniref:BZIP domain-containing protein n=1 Tax=Nippostrongylus brasiliensis TaxID=27835 RepID=A0A0N4YU27_NIPBR|nr:unnamed protein product [Nippostrongylus brasiliensis]